MTLRILSGASLRGGKRMDGVECFHDHVGPGDEMRVNKRVCLFRLCSELPDWPLCRGGPAVAPRWPRGESGVFHHLSNGSVS